MIILTFQAYEGEGDDLDKEAMEARQLERQIDMRRRREEPEWMK